MGSSIFEHPVCLPFTVDSAYMYKGTAAECVAQHSSCEIEQCTCANSEWYRMHYCQLVILPTLPASQVTLIQSHVSPTSSGCIQNSRVPSHSGPYHIHCLHFFFNCNSQFSINHTLSVLYSAPSMNYVSFAM